MNDTSKWILGIVGAVFASTVTAISTRALFAVGDMRDTLRTIVAEEPLREQLRAFEMEQIRQGLQLNSNELDVQKMKLDEIEDRVRLLERGP